jgi:hypothetical protein
MDTMREPRAGMIRGTAGQEAPTPGPHITTLYDLLTALQEVTGSDDELVVATVVYLLRSRRLTWPRQAGAAPGTLRCGAARTSPGGREKQVMLCPNFLV